MNVLPRVSIVMLTYYHEKYIRQALDSVLSQEVDFSFEIIIGDDASGDGTQNILREYAEKHPDIFSLILRPENIGATRNFCDVLERAKGAYIALLEGDDYWTDKGKLQKQIDFLDTHNEFIGCTHKCLVVDENGTPNYDIFPHWVKSKKVFQLEDFLDGEYVPGQTGTMVYRNVIKVYSLLYKIHPIVGDKTLVFMLLIKGKFYGFNQIMSAYRLVIDKESGKNWFSIHHSNPYWQYDAFMRPVRLEEYARSAGVNATIGPRRDYHYMSLVENIIKEPSLIRVKQLIEMTMRSRKALHCLGLIVKTIILR